MPISSGSGRRGTTGASVLALPAPAFLAAPAGAADFTYGNLTGSFDTTVSVGATWRAQDRASELVGIANGGTARSVNADDGNLNYDTGLISLAAKATHELALSWENYGAFLRGTYFYDAVNADGDGDRFARTGRTELSDDALDAVGRDIRLLDAYVYGSWEAGDHPVDLRVGNQVISWGESTFVPNGINVVNPFDLSAIRVPGAEVRDALVPVPMVDASVGLTENLGVEAFYQLDWEPTELEAAGTFFSSSDIVGPGARNAFLGFGNPGIADDPNAIGPANGTFLGVVNNPILGPLPVGGALNPAAPFGTRVPRGPDRKPEDQGQFGLALRYFAPELNDTEFGAYAVNYHSRAPVISAQLPTFAQFLANFGQYANNASYFLEYPEDIQLLGASFNTTVDALGISLQGEYSFRKDQPLQIDDVELLQAALAPAAVTANNLLLPVFRTNQVVQDLFGPSASLAQIQSLFGQELSGFREHDVSQAQVTATKAFGPAIGADQWVLVGELGVTHVHDLPDESTLRYEGPGTFLGGNPNFLGIGGMPAVQTDGFATQTSWGYRLRARFDFLNALGPVNLFPTVSWSHDVQGTTPLPLGNFVEGRKAISLGIAATYLESLTGELQYTSYFGGDGFNLIHDRDFVSLNVKYAF